jgi:cation transport ATPase
LHRENRARHHVWPKSSKSSSRRKIVACACAAESPIGSAGGLLCIRRGGVFTLIVTHNFVDIAVIIVAGACEAWQFRRAALAILAGIGSAARRGIITKGGLYLEQLSGIDTIVLGQTGTLTLRFPVTGGAARSTTLRQRMTCSRPAAIAEQHSEHPPG